MKLLDIVLTEMPKLIPPLKGHELNDASMNGQWYKDFDRDKYKKLIVVLNDHAIVSKDGTTFFCLDSDTKRVTYYLKYEVAKHSQLGQYVWQSMVWTDLNCDYIRGFPQKIFFDFLLPKYGCIVTDSEQTWYGQRFWQLRISEALKKGLFVYYFDFKLKQLVQVNDWAEFEQIEKDHDVWGPHTQNEFKRMIISNRKLIR